MTQVFETVELAQAVESAQALYPAQPPDLVDACWFCGEADKAPDLMHCGRPACRRYFYDLRRETDQYHLRERRRAIWHALVQRCDGCPDLTWWCRTFDLSPGDRAFAWLLRPRRWFYTIKAIVCVVLNRRAGLSGQIEIDHLDNVANWDEHPGVEAGSAWTELYVGRGLLSNWCYEISWNSSY